VTQPGDANSKFARDAWLRALGKTATIGDQGVTLPELIVRLAGEFDAAAALVSAESAMTYAQMGSRCNQYSHWGLSMGLDSGDAVSLLDVKLRRVSADLARTDAHRRGRRTGQFAARRRRVGALDQYRRSKIF